MATSSVTSATGSSLVDAPAGTNPNGILDKDDFMKLLLVELQYQDPTEPMDTEKILTQTSQLATLEATDNTNSALEELAASLQYNMQFSMIGSIGKMADTGSNAVVFEQGSETTFEIYFPEDVASGTIQILNADGEVLGTMPIDATSQGSQAFDWDGTLSDGSTADEGTYYITATYTDAAGETHDTRIGLYPIESVRFEDGETLVKLGSSYVPVSSITEVFEG